MPRHLDPLLLLVDVVVEFVSHLGKLHRRGFGIALAQDHHEPVGDLDDAGQFTGLEREHLPFECGLAAILLDRRHLAAECAAGGIDRILLGEITDSLRLRILPRKLPDLLGPALAIQNDDAALGTGAEGRLECLVEIILRYRHLAHELLERYRRLHDVFDIVPQGNLLVTGHAIEPGCHVGRAIRLAKAHRFSSPGNLSIDVGLGHSPLLTGEGLLDQSTGDQDLQHVATMPFDADRLHGLDLDRLAVDAGCHPGAGGRLGRVVHHVFHRRGILKAAEYLARGRSALSLAKFLEQPRPHVLKRRIGRWQSILTLDDDELVGHLHDRRDVARPQRKHRPLEPLVAGVPADGLHPAVGARAAHVDGMLPCQPAEIVRGGERLHPQFLRLFLGAGNDDPGLDRLAVLALECLLQLFRRRLDAGMGQPPQGEHRPDNVFGILPWRDAAFLFDETDPLVSGHAEPLRHGVDLGIDILWRDDDALPAAGLLDDLAIHRRLQDGVAVAAQALGSQLGLRDLRPIDHRHDLIGGGTCHGVFRRGIFTRRGRGTQWRLGVGLRRSRETSPEQADRDHKHRATNLADRAWPLAQPHRDSLAELLPDSSHRTALLGIC